MDSDGELLASVLARKDFLESVIHHDELDDWEIAKRLGDFLIRIEPESEILGHALKVRACRHLGEQDSARGELKQCHNRIAQRGLKPWEDELLHDLLKMEERALQSQ